MNNKTSLRIIAKTERKGLDINGISRRLCCKLRNMPFYQTAKNVMLFYPMKYEINTLELLDDEKNFYFPRVAGEDILVCPYCDRFTVSEFSVKEPCSNPVDANTLDLVIVPALMVDKNNYRLGYGGGFYDKFLAKYPHIMTVTLLPKQFCVESLPHEEFDVAVKCVIYM